jgi:hypothetical protein
MRTPRPPLSALLVGLLSVGLLSLAAPCRAETSPLPSEDSWSFRVAPYLWATALNGDIGVRGVETHVDASVGEVLEHVDGGAMITGEARYGRWASVTDFIYADLAARKSFDDGAIESAKVKISEYIWTQAGAYRALESGKNWLDVMAGFRLMSLDQKLTVSARDPFAPSGTISPSASLDRTWIDPIVGVRSAVTIHDRWALRTEGDIGGFNANSKLTWQALAAVGYDASESTRLLVGYRGLGYEHDREGFRYDAIMHGPIVGAGFGF